MSDEQFQNPADKSVAGARGGRKIQPPKGTRDLYPEEMLRRRYVTQTWRDVSIRHGFEEVDGPTFEAAELYAVKSGEGILGELFQAFSGKAEEEREQVRATGRAPFAMRPEFTPTLARMYAAKASALPRPCKWFMIGPFFRAERPQRGRLREFLQWNCDVLGDDGTPEGRAQADAEVIAKLEASLESFGLTSENARVKFSHRELISRVLLTGGVKTEQLTAALDLVDAWNKLTDDQFWSNSETVGFSQELAADLTKLLGLRLSIDELRGFDWSKAFSLGQLEVPDFSWLTKAVLDLGSSHMLEFDSSIVRGLAYYTGTVFEAIADGERAVAGGGRYDKLVELFGGPPTPAVGFAMGDVVLSLLLEDKKLMPTGAELLEACSRPTASLRPEAFVVTADAALDETVLRVTAELRRPPTHYRLDGTGRAVACASDGQDARPAEELKPWQRPAGLHARRSYKTTRNVGKLLDDAKKQHALCAVIVESAETAKVERLDTRESRSGVPLDRVGLTVRAMLGQIPA